MGGRRRVVVIGAGAFGGWTALTLRRRGCEVVLVDAWGPGHARSSSGGETRVLRLAYTNPVMLKLADRARHLWLEEESKSGRNVFESTGLLWMAPRMTEVERLVITNLGDANVPHEWLDRDQLVVSYPQIQSEDLEGAIFEQGAGVLRASAACQMVRDALIREGGTYREAWVEPGTIRSEMMQGVILSDGSRLTADAYVFAVGPWQGTLLQSIQGFAMPVTRQEVFVFGTPKGDDRYCPRRLPVWAEHGEAFWYGIPGDGGVGGFKVADDTRGPELDPSTGDRTASAEGLKNARSYLTRRFPGLADAPLIVASVCQYTEAIDGRFLADHVRGTTNAWAVYGGSGHGFKHGPAVGEYVASLVMGDEIPGSSPAFSTLADYEGRGCVQSDASTH